MSTPSETVDHDPDLVRVAIYGDVDINYIDGSSIWLVSLAQTIASIDRVDLTLFLKAPVARDEVIGVLREVPNLAIVEPMEGRLTPQRAVMAISEHHSNQRFDAAILRGFDVALAAADSRLAGVLWTYLTDMPQRQRDLTEETTRQLQKIAEASAFVLCQTEEIRAYLESLIPKRTRFELLPPMIPDSGKAPSPRTNKIVYAGKFAPGWAVLEAVAAFVQLRDRHPDLEFHVVGDKIHNPPSDPTYRERVEKALQTTPGLVWHGAQSRAEVNGIVRTATVALSARAHALNDSLELSTKILEYGQAGAGVVMNRTAIHEATFGPDYPLFVDDLDRDLVSTIDRALLNPRALETAIERTRAVAERHTFTATARRIAPFFHGLRGRGRLHGRRVAVAGHDLKFARPLIARMRAEGAEVRIDKWTGHRSHDPYESAAMVEWADTVICEWCLGNAVWYSQHVSATASLYVRFHRVEIDTDYPSEVETNGVDRFVFVSSHAAESAMSRFGWGSSQLKIIPNTIRAANLLRAKVPGAEFTLGMIGMLPALKRLDLVLDSLTELRRCDPRYTLAIRGRLPWQLQWVWNRDAEREYFKPLFERINSSPLLRESVVFDGFGPVAPWLRKIGYITSFSDVESFHIGLAEGMASGAVPVVRQREGVEELFGDRWLVHSPKEAAERIISIADRGQRSDEAAKAIQTVGRFDEQSVLDEWVDLVVGGLNAKPRR